MLIRSDKNIIISNVYKCWSDPARDHPTLSARTCLSTSKPGGGRDCDYSSSGSHLFSVIIILSWILGFHTNAIDYIQFPSLTAEWLEPLIPVCIKLTMAALFLQTTLWRGLAQCFDFCNFLVSVYPRRV